MAENTNPWALYDCLIAAIPPEHKADEAISGEHWSYVRSGDRVGLAMNLGHLSNNETRPRTLPDSCRGMALRDLATAAKSWNIAEASLGVAAINAYWNSPEHKKVRSALAEEDMSAFEAWKGRVAGKKVAVVGHFMHLERILGPVCELSILEKRPGPGDYPDSACEFIIPFQDFVFATGVTLVNKTLPRLLELSRRQGMILTGPTTPLSPLLFDFGVRDLQGLVLTDPDLCRDVITGKREGTIFDAGKRVGIARG
ncbi:conserved hypothetical protein [Treponema primitia ZAS-2]|uniref:DUF364 domain-containing protein n=1 Tax=Treponema primitia (strain ATCC BAA-887 / DSM 12427 / ZAS-2) TaxID=545694 RepID=F5YH73_TREPZ|nr:DUF364 domain-containing protein [Treponema primitia]AEF85808.1 conserved hypothetical protein [Treponema primitia ZAS-2]